MKQSTLHAKESAQKQPSPEGNIIQLSRHRRTCVLLTIVAVALALAAGTTGYNLAGRQPGMSYLEMRRDQGYYIPVESTHLTVRITPLEMGPQALAAYNKPDSDRERRAWDLTGPGLDRALPRLADAYPLQFEIGDPLTIPDEFFISHQQQYRADLILDWLVQQTDADSFRTIGVLPVDIYQPDYNYLFGLAKLGGRACIASSSRMGMHFKDDSFLADERWQSILRHEFGHTLGLQHVNDRCSVMAYSNSMEQLDMTGQSLSASDWARLEELHPVRWNRW